MRRSELELKRGSILRKELLEDICDFPRIATETYYSGHSDGILYGLEWLCSKKNEKQHIITPGALKYNGNIYFLREQIEVEDMLKDTIVSGEKYRLCFEEQEAYKDIDTITIFELKLRAVKSAEYQQIKGKSFCYARVMCVNNSCLERIYDGDIYGLFAADDGYKYKFPNFVLTDKVQGCIEEKADKHPLDYMLLKDIYEKKGLSVSMTVMYLNECKVSISEDEMNCPEKLLAKLLSAIEKLKMQMQMQIINDDKKTLLPEEDTVSDGGTL